MREILQRMLAAEEEAAKLVAAGEKEARTITQEAQQQAAQRIESARQSAQAQAQARYKEVVAAAHTEKENALRRASRELAASLDALDPNRKMRAARRAAAAILGQELAPISPPSREGRKTEKA